MNHCVQLKPYENYTVPFRTRESKSILLLSWIGKHDPVSSSTIVRWLQTCLQDAGVLLAIVHQQPGHTTDIFNAADWSSETTFQQFYHREIKDRSTFGSTVLSSADTSNLHVDMETEPSEM